MLIERLTKGDNKHHQYPMTPEQAASLIVMTLLADLPQERKERVREAIEEWGTEWGSAVSSTAAESTYR